MATAEEKEEAAYSVKNGNVGALTTLGCFCCPRNKLKNE
jgi:hypothetical protein